MVIGEISEFLPLDKPSIICLNEIDHYWEFYKPELDELGYESVIRCQNDKVACLVGWDKRLYRFIGIREIHFDDITHSGALYDEEFK